MSRLRSSDAPSGHRPAIACHITSVSPVFDVRVFERECRTLADHGYDVRLIAAHDRAEVVSGVQIVPLPRVRYRPLRLILLPFLALVKALSQRADVYEVHDPELIPMALLLKSLGRKVIYAVREDHPRNAYFKDYLPGWSRAIVSAVIAAAERLMTWRADAVIAVTADIADSFRSARRVSLIRNYPVPSRSYSVKRSRPQEAQPFVVLYVGVLAKSRGLIQLLQAMEILDRRGNYVLRLAGGFSGAAFERAVRELRAFHNVEYLGSLLPGAIPALMVDADVGVVCLLPERHFLTSLPLKMFEYMAAGLPIVASNFPEWLPLVEGSGAGVCVDPQRPEEIAAAIERICTDRQLATACSVAGRRAVRERFNWEQEAKKLLALYGELLQSSA